VTCPNSAGISSRPGSDPEECGSKAWMQRFWGLPRLLVCALLVVSAATSAVGQAEDLDLEAFLIAAEARLAENMRAWGEVAFRRQVTRRFIDKNGEISEQHEYDLWVTPTAEGFDEELRRINGREPTRKEIKEHRNKGRHADQYDEFSSLELRNPAGENLPLASIIHGPVHRVVGEEEIHGQRCYRLRFESQPEPQKANLTDRLIAAMEGTAWLTVDGANLARVKLRIVRPISKRALGANEMEIILDLAPFDTYWLPTQLEMISDVKVARKHISRHNSYAYSEYSRP
jgi:hypothetical protein